MEFTKVQIEKAKQCKTLEELKVLAKNEGLNLTEEETKMYFEATRGGELSDEDLDKVAGGAKGWEKAGGYEMDIICPFCGNKFHYDETTYKKGDEYKYESENDTCSCGAKVRCYSITHNADFTKNGESKTVPALYFHWKE